MSNTLTFVMAGPGADDARLSTLIRSCYLARSPTDRVNWLLQTELGLDGYGDRHRDTVTRIRNILRLLKLELNVK